MRRNGEIAMALEDFVDPEVGVAVAATAVVFSPTVRGWLRRGLVLGIAGVMKAADSVGDAARNVAGEAQNAVSSTVSEAQATAASPPRASTRAPKSTPPAEK